MFIRKLYYDLSTGAVVRSSMMQGHVKMTTTEHDMSVLPELAPYANAPETLGCMLWTQPDPDVEDCMSRATGLSVDVTQTPHVIVYDYTPLPELPPEPSPDAEEILAIIEGTMQEGE